MPDQADARPEGAKRAPLTGHDDDQPVISAFDEPGSLTAGARRVLSKASPARDPSQRRSPLGDPSSAGYRNVSRAWDGTRSATGMSDATTCSMYRFMLL